MSDTLSTHSTISNATTLKNDPPTQPKSKWYLPFSKTSQTPKSTPKSSSSSTNKDADDGKEKEVHNEAIATYLAFR